MKCRTHEFRDREKGQVGQINQPSSVGKNTVRGLIYVNVQVTILYFETYAEPNKRKTLQLEIII